MTDKYTPTPRTAEFPTQITLQNAIDGRIQLDRFQLATIATCLSRLERETAALRQQLEATENDRKLHERAAHESDMRCQAATRGEKELRQQLAALEQKRREDVRKCEYEAVDHAKNCADKGYLEKARTASTIADRIRAAFPEVFK